MKKSAALAGDLLESGERGERQHGVLSAEGRSEPGESTERESKARSKGRTADDCLWQESRRL